jgi:RNA recognition motif-containing protein
VSHSHRSTLANILRLYITNLPSSKIQKSDLRLSLYTLFSTYGPVLDVVALKTMKMRGQAHIVYRDIQTATQAMRALQGFNFFGMDMVGSSIPKAPSNETQANLFFYSKYNTPKRNPTHSQSLMGLSISPLQLLVL